MRDTLKELKSSLKEIDNILKENNLNIINKEKTDCKKLLFSYKYLLKYLNTLKNKRKKINFLINQILKPSDNYLSTDIKKSAIKYFRDNMFICDEFSIEHMRFDLFAVEKYKNRVIGFEIKTSLSDLKNDSKFENYLNYSNILYFIVPEKLKEDALKKIKKSSLKKHIGLYVYLKENNSFKLIKKAYSNKKEFNKEHYIKGIQERIYNKYIYSV